MTAPTETRTRSGASTPADLSAARRSRRMRWGLVIAGVLTAAAVISAAYVVFGTHVLAVRAVSIRGATIVSKQDILNAAAVPVGTPLARVDVAGVRSRVAALPRVSSVNVRRGWPHELVIVIHEYSPVAVTQIGGKWFLVDPSGVAFMPAPSSTTLPQVQGNNATSRAAAIVVAKHLPSNIARHVVLVRANRPDQVELVLTANGLVIWGDTSASTAKAEVLIPLLALQAKKYDVSVPSAPTITR